jgi:hypothetical protein
MMMQIKTPSPLLDQGGSRLTFTNCPPHSSASAAHRRRMMPSHEHGRTRNTVTSGKEVQQQQRGSGERKVKRAPSGEREMRGKD